MNDEGDGEMSGEKADGKCCQRYDCIYHPSVQAENGCDYIIITGQPRGCERGRACTRFKKSQMKRKAVDWTEFMPLYEQGLTDRQIAERMGLRKGTVGAHRRGLGLAGKTGSKIKTEEILALRRQGLRVKEMAERLGVKNYSVKRWFERHGLSS